MSRDREAESLKAGSVIQQTENERGFIKVWLRSAVFLDLVAGDRIR